MWALCAAFASVAMACSSTSPDAFVGTWRYEAGSMSMSDCDGDGTFDSSDAAGRQFTLVESLSADIEMSADVPCPILFDITDETAAARDLTCGVTLIGSGCPVAMGTMRHWPFTLKLAGGGTTLIVEDRWYGLSGTNGCGARWCVGVLMGTASKVN